MVAFRDLGSFRDPGGAVYLDDHRVLRTVTSRAAEQYRAVRDSGIYEAMTEKNFLLCAREVKEKVPGLSGEIAHLLEHPRLAMISYPYEWCFSAHRKAALLHLDLHLALLEKNFTLSDATAYNVQFEGARPVFIDHLSIRPWKKGEIWAGHRQFCMQFLNPLLMHAKLGVAPNAWFRGGLEGIAPEDLAPLLPLRCKLSWNVLTHVILQASLQKKSAASGTSGRSALKKATLPPEGFRGMLQGLRNHIEKLSLPPLQTVWSDYAQSNSYEAEEKEAKRRFVSEMAAKVRPAILWDIGCNTGDFTQAALEAGAQASIGWDFDHGALEQAFARAEHENLNFLPLWLDAANPSPSQGWGQCERAGFAERANANALLALAFIHHIAIGRNIPLEYAVDWLISLAPAGVIEFPPKSDAMVQRLLARREDIFPDYHEGAFTAYVERRARIVRKETLNTTGRVLLWYDRT